MLISTVRGSFSGVAGEIVYDPDDPTRSSVRVEIDAASIDTGNKDRDNHLKGPDFFDVANYPKITFESTKVEKRGDNWVAYGQLTIKGVTREIAIPFRLNGPIKDPWGNLRIGVEAETITLNRQDFGISWNQVLDAGGLAVGNEVSVYISAEAAAQTP
jgi:polyisoprenoid-binding protein YceI